MSTEERFPSGPIRLQRYVWPLMAAWTAAIGATFTWGLIDEWNQTLDLARAEARGAFRKDYGFLRWYSAQGGIYVPAGAAIKSSPYLASVPERDLATPSGQRLTLVSPTDLIREVRELSEEESKFQANLRGLRPVHPGNAADPWERKALASFARGKDEATSMVTAHGESYMRLMRPLILERGCLKCHPEEELRVGEEYGGISVAFPMASVWSMWRAEATRRVVGYGGLALLGLFGIALGSRGLRRQMERRRQAEQALLERDAEMLAAERIQEHLLPQAPPALPGFDVAGASSPAEYTSGDYFDYIPMPGETIGFAIGDVSGHGYGPALLMASTYTLLRSLAQADGDIGQILAHANRFLSQITPPESFVTLFLGRLDPRARSLRYASAGHPAGYVLDRTGAVKARLESTAPPLGVVPHARFSAENSVAMEPGDTVLLLTDGVPEARSPEGAVFGEERVLEVVSANREKTAAEIVKDLFRAVRGFTRREKPIDDMTAVVIKVDPPDDGHDGGSSAP
jgi:serine phosphatase RsbU (regulator of sigma subunit)